MENKEKLLKREAMISADNLFVRENEDGSASRKIAGYAILFNTESEPLWSDNESEAREVIAREAVTQELLDGSDIKFTMFHDRQLILARSRYGKGTLSYSIDDKGVAFEFEAPNTVDGDKALELVRRGELAGCSFMFTTQYYNRDFVTRDAKTIDGRRIITYTVNCIERIYDFTLAADPAYSETNVELRENDGEPEPDNSYLEQVKQMRALASSALV